MSDTHHKRRIVAVCRIQMGELNQVPEQAESIVAFQCVEHNPHVLVCAEELQAFVEH